MEKSTVTSIFKKFKSQAASLPKPSVTDIVKRLKARGQKISPPIPAEVWQSPLYFVGFGFGSGAIPFAPGTFGTLFAIPFYLLLQWLPLSAYIGFTVVFALFSMWVCERLSRQIQSHDHPGMCIDEFAGFLVTMINAPHGAGWVLLGFVLFRLLDIFKPWPIRYLDEKIHGGIGMVLDDIVAGIFAMLIIQLLRIFS